MFLLLIVYYFQFLYLEKETKNMDTKRISFKFYVVIFQIKPD